KGTNKKQSITISNSSGLSDEEIERMVREAEENASEDLRLKEEAELKNRAEQFIHQIDESLASEDSPVDDAQKEEVTKLRDELQAAMDNNDFETLKEKLDQLEQAAQAMSQAMYEQQAGQAEADASSSDETVVDAEFEEKN
ncbi:Hsp70 family protein, partial [Erysipelothrix rhusiopathiae]|nr:Hsp70 family protein [Erysipelothrix rhusiopathiae]